MVIEAGLELAPEAVVEKPPEPGAPLMRPGQILAPGFEVVAHVRRGRDLDVYDVWSEERACRCVAKVLRPDRLDDPSPGRKLLQEGRLLQQLCHPHIVRAYEAFERPYPKVILETLTGETLEHLVTRCGRLPVTEVAWLGLHLSSAMHYLHRQSVLHLDLKPSNIVSERGTAKVLDLSIARPPGPCPRGVGTRQYMAPEQARGGEASPKTDVWGIGAVLFEAATGKRPFRALGGPSYEQLERRAERVRVHRRVPAALAQAIDACLEPEQAHRPTVEELIAALREAAGCQS